MWRLFLLSCATLSSLSAQEHFFPLEVGNVWVYRGAGTRAAAPLILEITETDTFDGRVYYHLHGEPGGDYWLRFREDGALMQRDDKTGSEKLWYAFRSPVGEIFNTAIPFCCGRAMLAKDPAAYDPPSGLSWSDAKEFSFPAVFQFGLTREIFAPYVGMVYRSQNTGGPSFATYDFAYARIGGVTVLSEPSIGFTVSANPYFVRLSVENGFSNPLTLLFSSSQLFDVAVFDDQGNDVFRWSQGKEFAAALQTLEVNRHRDWVIPLPQLQPGAYTVRGWLMVSDQPAKAWSATTSLTIPALASDETSKP